MEFSDDDLQIEKRVVDLIERGLERYGAGDMEGALGQWEHALALDPDNERAAKYLEYVEEHHDLVGDAGDIGESTVELAYPFGVSTLGLAKLTEQELEDYESFEIVEAASALPEPSVVAISESAVDDGWSVDEGWVEDLVSKSEAAFTPSPADERAEESVSADPPTLAPGSVDPPTLAPGSVDPPTLAPGSVDPPTLAPASIDPSTLDIALAPGSADDEQSTRVHRSSDKLRTLAGFDELELDEAQSEDDEEEEELTRARLDSLPRLHGRASSIDAETLELELDDEEESTKFHESPRRVGTSHSAASSDFEGLELGGLDDIGLGGRSGSPPTPKPPLLPNVADAIDATSDRGASIDFHEPSNVGAEPSDEATLDLEGTRELDIGRRGAGRSGLGKAGQFGMDDELTIDRSELVSSRSKSRAPTHDHNISSSSISVDDALLSLQDSTRELDLRDMELPLPGTSRGASTTANVKGQETASVDQERDTKDFSGPIVDAGSDDGEDGILATIISEAPEGDEGERTLYIVNRLIEHGGDEFTDGRAARAALAVCEALDYASDSAIAQKAIFESEHMLIEILMSSLGDAGQTPRLVCALTDIPSEHINHRAAFLLTRLDPGMTLDELLDISGMPRLEALRHLSGLHVRNYLEVV